MVNVYQETVVVVPIWIFQNYVVDAFVCFLILLYFHWLLDYSFHVVLACLDMIVTSVSASTILKFFFLCNNGQNHSDHIWQHGQNKSHTRKCQVTRPWHSLFLMWVVSVLHHWHCKNMFSYAVNTFTEVEVVDPHGKCSCGTLWVKTGKTWPSDSRWTDSQYVVRVGGGMAWYPLLQPPPPQCVVGDWPGPRQSSQESHTKSEMCCRW